MMELRLKARLRLWAIYNELGFNPWHRKHAGTKKDGDVYMGAREIIPFLNQDGKRTISHLFLRPGYMMRDYIFRGQHERYLAPITALLVFYSVFTLLVAIVQPGSQRNTFGQGILDALDSGEIYVDTSHTHDAKTEKFVRALFQTVTESIVITHLDLYPEAADTPWKESLAAVESDIRSKGIPLFLGNFLMIWLAMSILLRKYKMSVSGAAAASAYVLCQFCIFMFLALALSFGNRSDLGLLLMGILLFIDYRQMLGIRSRPALKLTVKTGLVYLFFTVVFYGLVGLGLILFAYYRA